MRSTSGKTGFKHALSLPHDDRPQANLGLRKGHDHVILDCDRLARENHRERLLSFVV